MKHILALVASLVLGVLVAALVARVAFPHIGEFSYAPPIIIFPIFSIWVSLPTYGIAIIVNAVRTKEPDQKKHPVWGVLVATGVTLIVSITIAVILWWRETHH